MIRQVQKNTTKAAITDLVSVCVLVWFCRFFGDCAHLHAGVVDVQLVLEGGRSGRNDAEYVYYGDDALGAVFGAD